jgi:hypothetical protein
MQRRIALTSPNPWKQLHDIEAQIADDALTKLRRSQEANADLRTDMIKEQAKSIAAAKLLAS